MQIKTVFENEQFVAVDKPALVLTVPGREKSDKRLCLSREISRGEGRVWPVHRLDYEVSGLVLFAKNERAHKLANGWFEERAVRKYYEAWTKTIARDWNLEEAREWRASLLRGKRRAYESPRGKPSLTRVTWKGLVEWRKAALGSWLLEPLTGRSHQLRYELSRHGYPILGDALYGSSDQFVDGAIALRAVALDLSSCSEAKDYGLPERIRCAGLAEVFA